jgi:hypothetical protein
MRDVELYRLLLGIEAPWEVQSVDLSVADQKVDVMVGHAKRVRWPCPECGTERSVYDHAEERACAILTPAGLSPGFTPARRGFLPCSRGAPGAAAVGRAACPLHHAV